MTAVEFGVEWTLDGEPVFVATGYTKTGAEEMVAGCSSKGWAPAAARVVCRDVGEWRPVDGPITEEDER